VFDDYEKKLIELDESERIDFHVPEAEEIRQLKESARESLDRDNQTKSER
jgi:hypothetical protein